MDVRLATLTEDLEREMLDVCLNLRIIKLASDETLRIEHTAEQWVKTCKTYADKWRTYYEDSWRLGSLRHHQ